MTTKIPVELSSTPGIVDGSNATAITINSSEQVGIGVTPVVTLDVGGASDLVASLRSSTNNGNTSEAKIRAVDSDSSHVAIFQYQGYQHRFQDASANELVRIDNSGNVGIGTTSPDDDLHIRNTTQSGATLRLENSNISTDANTVYGTINFEGNDNSSNANGIRASIVAHSESTAGATSLRFSTGEGGSANAEKMRITNAGKVGIGTTSPSNLLHVTSSGSTPFATQRDVNSGGFAMLQGKMGDSASTTAGHVYTALVAGIEDNTNGAEDGYFAVEVSEGGSASERMRIDSSGKIIAAGGFCSEDGITVIGQSERTHFQAIDSEASTAPRWRPSVDNVADLGDSSLRWDDVRATNGTIQTSDRNEKNTITDSDLGLDFVKRLSPKSYKFNGKTRTHYGLIAQDVETVLSDISKSTTDFAGYIKDDISEEQDGSELRYGLRYTEFVSPLVKAIQEQQEQIEQLKAEIQTLKGE